MVQFSQKDGDSVLSRNGGEVFKKDLKRVAGFKVIEQCLDGHTRARENRCAAVDFGVNGDERGVHVGPSQGLDA